MLYRFPVARHQDVESADRLLVHHLEEILLLGTLADDNGRLRPTHVLIPAQQKSEADSIYRLFARPQSHLWRPDQVTTTKDQLVMIRQAGDCDGSYDIDVLRMSEPRIVLILHILELLNQLSHVQRSEVLRLVERYEPSPERGAQPVNDTIAEHITIVLRRVCLLDGYRTLSPRSYSFHQLPVRDRPLQLGTTAAVHGRDVLHDITSNLLSLISVDHDSEAITQFSLRNYDQWTTATKGDPYEILGALSRDCNARCDFCYVKGNPTDTAIKLPRFSVKHSSHEARTRLSYFRRGLTLPIPTYDTEEITIHPDFLDICKGIREVSQTCISLTTNGYRLTEDFLVRLLEYAPIDVSLSLNAAHESTRQWLMGGAHKRGLETLSLLQKYRIPCAVTFAAWPRVPIDEYIDSVLYADQFNARSISVLLGGFTRLFPNPPHYPMPQYWNSVIDAIAPLRSRVKTPLILQPRLYEEQYRMRDTLGSAIVTGINKHSPASAAGLEVYDKIVAIEGSAIITRTQCLSLLSLLRNQRRSIVIHIEREGIREEIRIEGDTRNSEYLYDLPFNDRYGIHLIGEDIRLRSIQDIYHYVNQYGAKRILFLTSMIVRPLLTKHLEELSFLSHARDVEFDLQIPQNRFLGGNIVMGDMLVLDDLAECISEYIDKNGMPDLVLIPSGPFNHGGWLRDMKGQAFELIRHMFPLPIEMIEAPYFE